MNQRSLLLWPSGRQPRARRARRGSQAGDLLRPRCPGQEEARVLEGEAAWREGGGRGKREEEGEGGKSSRGVWETVVVDDGLKTLRGERARAAKGEGECRPGALRWCRVAGCSFLSGEPELVQDRREHERYKKGRGRHRESVWELFLDDHLFLPARTSSSFVQASPCSYKACQGS